MTGTFLTISSKNYSSWSLRGWLLCRMAGLDFVEEVVPADDPANRAELLLLSPSMLVPCRDPFLTYDVKLDRQCDDYCERIMALPDMVAWRSAAMLEPEELEELDMEF